MAHAKNELQEFRILKLISAFYLVGQFLKNLTKKIKQDCLVMANGCQSWLIIRLP